MISGGRIRKDVDININLFDKNFGQKIKHLSDNLNKNLGQIQKTSQNFGVSTQSLSKYQDMFNLSLTKTGKSLKTVDGRLLSNSNQLQQHIGKQAGFGNVMRMNQQQYQKFNESGVKMNKMGGRMGLWLRNATHGMRGFRMEMLGVMFFGMSLTRVFNGLIKTSMDWMGVTEVFTTTLGILFLPVAELVLDWALIFLEWVGNLTEDQKKLIGMFVLFGIALGGILTLFGALALGIGSLIMAFGWLLSPLGLVIAAFTAIAGYVIIKSFFKDTGSAVDTLRNKLVAFGVSGEVFDKVANKIKDWYGTVKNYLFGNEQTGDIGFIGQIKDKIIEFSNSDDIKTAGRNIMNKLVEGAKDFFASNPLVLIGAIIGALTAGPLGAGIGAAIGEGLETFDAEKMQEVIDKGLEILTGIIDGVIENKENVSAALEAILGAMGDWIGQNGEELADVGEAIGKGIIKGIPKVLWGFVEGAFELGGSIGDKVSKNIKTNSQMSIGEKVSASWPFNTESGNTESGNDFILQPNGKMIKTNPNDYLFATTNPHTLGGKGETITINSTYYVTVSDKREFESLLRKNNEDLKRDVMRFTSK